MMNDGAVGGKEPSDGRDRCARCGQPEWDRLDGRAPYEMYTHPLYNCPEFVSARCRQCGAGPQAEVHNGPTHFMRMVEVLGRGPMPTMCYHHFFTAYVPPKGAEP